MLPSSMRLTVRKLLKDVGSSSLTRPVLLSAGTDGSFIDYQKVVEKVINMVIDSLHVTERDKKTEKR